MFAAYTPAILALADGTVFHGRSIGAPGSCCGEVVFNTALTGYQEILTDPSYCSQIVTLTYPHIGNTGINQQDNESAKIQAAGLVIRDLPEIVSNFRSQQTLSKYLQDEGVVALANIDTRKLTRILRQQGAQSGCILAGGESEKEIQQALAKAKGFPGIVGADLAKVVTTSNVYEWRGGEWDITDGFKPSPTAKYHVVAYDFGIKRNILRMLTQRAAMVTVVPAQTSLQEVLKLKPDGLFFSNGPGDPAACDYAINAAQEILRLKIPTFGICLGHQIMALASNARTIKMKFGHHGANHPVKDLNSNKVFISSQNHGFSVDINTLPDNLQLTHISLFDGSLQGLAWKNSPALSFQGHPEASPGPHDVAYLFNKFFNMLEGQVCRKG